MHLLPEEAAYVHSLVNVEDRGSRVEAANALLKIIGQGGQVDSLSTAELLLKSALKGLLSQGEKLTATSLCWGQRIFNPYPRSVKLIFSRLQTHPALLIFGSQSMGKSYTVAAEKLLDFEEDPEFTTIFVVSTTAGHAKGQIFSTFVRLHRSSAVPLSGFINDGFIGLDRNDQRSAIVRVAIEKGEHKGAKLQGYHPLPRPYPHPKFGWQTRVRGVFDEMEANPPGVWQGESNIMGNLDKEMHVAIVGMWNPDDITSEAAARVEPPGGWDMLDERLDEYKSSMGYHVIRLDGRKSENVVARKEVYPGILTSEGLKGLEQKGGAHLMQFGYGLYSKDIATFGIIARATLDKCRGNFIWAGHTTDLAALDMAEEGPDRVQLCCGRYGPAIAYEPEYGERIKFRDTRYCLQVEQLIEIPKQDHIVMGAGIIKTIKTLKVRPEWFGLDCTGSVTMRDWMRNKFGEVIGIKWGEGASERPILWEDKEKASDLYLNVKTEMWFACNAWAQFGYLCFTPNMETNELFNELSSMRYRHVGKLLKRCEKTAEYKKRMGGKSPDKAASTIMMIHIARAHAEMQQNPAMQPEKVQRDVGIVSDEFELIEDTAEIYDEIKFI